MFPSRGLWFSVHCWDSGIELICESEESFCVCLKMKCQRRERIGVPLFHDSWVVQVFVCVFAEMSRQVRHHHQSCCFEREPTLWPLCSECESSISLCTQHARKPSPFFFLFPSLVTGKGSIFSFHIWSYGAPPVSSSLLMPYKHPYFVWDMYFLECFFSQFCLIVGVASESALLKGTQAF